MTFAYRARKHCIVCGRTGTTNFQLAPQQPSEFVRLYICTAALACMRRAKIGVECPGCGNLFAKLPKICPRCGTETTDDPLNYSSLDRSCDDYYGMGR